MKVSGVNGQLEVTQTKVIIKRKGILAKMTQGLKGDKEIQIKQISSIQFKKASALTNGYIQFSFSGSKEDKGGLFDATQDENSVMFSKKQMPEFEKAKELIETQINSFHSIPSQQMPSSDVADQIKKLADLRDSGILTEEEFTAKKKQLLGV